MNGTQTARKWTIAEPDWPRARALAGAADVPPLAAHLLLRRGIETPDAARDFLYPALAQLSDPFLLSDMDVAVARLAQARDRGEMVLIFGDYDVDGVTGMAILVQAFRRFGLANFSYGMPLRLSEGYGLNPDHVNAAHADGVSLIVTVDNGMGAHAAADRARELGIDLIVTDHHAIEDTLPHALAVLNPKRESPDYPGSFLCGAGVAFKLSTALNGTPNDLDIAAVGTVADIVPLRAENRAIVALGIKHMTKYQRNGLAKLARQSGFELPSVSAEKIGFQLGPRINAAGRLDDAAAALRLLLTECPDEACALARLLNQANEERRTIEKAIYEEAIEELDACFTPDKRAIVLARAGWHPGVIGIVASRIENQYHRPVVIIAIDDEGVGRGSARGGPRFDLVSALGACSAHLEKYGGHCAAAGLTLRGGNIPGFTGAFEEEALRRLGAGAIVPELEIDAIAAFSQIDAALVKGLEMFEPIGRDNPAPVFCSLGVEAVPQSAQVLKERHLKLLFRQGGVALTAIGFGMAELLFQDRLRGPLDIAYTPQFNHWNGDSTIQLLIKDIRKSE